MSIITRAIEKLEAERDASRAIIDAQLEILRQLADALETAPEHVAAMIPYGERFGPTYRLAYAITGESEDHPASTQPDPLDELFPGTRESLDALSIRARMNNVPDPSMDDAARNRAVEGWNRP